MPRKLKCIDMLLHKNVAEAFTHTYNFLLKCMKNDVQSMSLIVKNTSRGMSLQLTALGKGKGR